MNRREQLEDRILELGLRRTLGDLSARDHTEEILDRLREAQFGTDPNTLTDASQPPNTPAPQPQNPWRRLLWVAASVFGTLGLIFGLQWMLGAPEVAHSNGAVLVLRGPELQALRTQQCLAGDHTWSLTDTELRLASGTRIEMQAETLLRLDTDHVQILTGSVDLRSQDAKASIRVAQDVDARLDHRSRLRLRLQTTSISPSPETPNAEQVRTMIRNPKPMILTFTLLAGTAEVQAAGWQQTLQQDRPLVVDLQGKPTPQPKIDAQVRVRVDKAVRVLLSARPTKDRTAKSFEREIQQRKRMIDAAETLAHLVERVPQVLPRVRQLVPLLDGKDAVPGRRGAVLQALVQDKAAATRSKILGLLAKSAKNFSVAQLLELAQDGAGIAEATLRKQLKARPDDTRYRMAAVWFALKGQDIGSAMLQRTVLKALAQGQMEDQHLAAALGLFRLGKRSGWNEISASLRKFVQEGLNGDKAEVLMAGIRICSYMYFLRATRDGVVVPMPALSDPVSRFTQPHYKKLTDKEYVRKLFESAFKRK